MIKLKLGKLVLITDGERFEIRDERREIVGGFVGGRRLEFSGVCSLEQWEDVRAALDKVAWEALEKAESA